MCVPQIFFLPEGNIFTSWTRFFVLAQSQSLQTQKIYWKILPPGSKFNFCPGSPRNRRTQPGKRWRRSRWSTLLTWLEGENELVNWLIQWFLIGKERKWASSKKEIIIFSLGKEGTSLFSPFFIWDYLYRTTADNVFPILQCIEDVIIRETSLRTLHAPTSGWKPLSLLILSFVPSVVWPTPQEN